VSAERRSTSQTALAAALPLVLMVAGVWIAWTGPFPWVHAQSRVPIDIYLVGVIQGSLIALVTLAIIIVYRANRIINFAAADLGAAPASFALLLWGALGWNIYLAMGIGFASAIVLGVIVEFLVIRPFFNAPRLILMVVTIVLTELLSALALFLPQWFGSPDKVQYDPFINVHFHLGKLVTFDGSDVMVLIVVPLVLVGLVAFFRFSAIGVALRASAESADRASLLGIPVRRLQSVVWGLAAILAFVAVWLRIGVGGEVLGRYLDPAVLLTALGAAVIGRMERMPTAVLAAIGFGIVDQAATFHFNAVGVQDVAVVAAIVLIALLLQRANTVSRLASSASSTWQATREIRRIPAELRREGPVRAAYAAVAALVLAFLVAIPLLLPGDKVQLAGVIAIFGIIGLSLVVLTGWSGQVSLGQMGFVGLSGAVAGTLANRWHWDMGLILLTAGAVGAASMIIVGLPTLRARGLTFAVATLAFSLAVSTYLLNTGYSPIQSWIPSGSINRTHFLGLFAVDTDTKFYVLILAVLGACILMLRSLRASRIGRVLIGVRDNERVAQAYSVNARGALAMAFGISGFLAGVAGALFVLQQQSLDSANFDPTQGLLVFSMAVIGGVGSIGGAVLGAVYLKGLQYFLTQPQFALLATGAGVLIVLYIFKGGLGAAFGDARNAGLRWYARRQGIRVPSLLADTRVDANLPKSEELDIAAALTDAAERSETLVEVHE
jgi:branched-chain amino acid transport system permease protein